MKVYSKLKVTKNVFNLQKWHQNTRNLKSLFQQIVYKPFTVGIKTNNLPRTTRFGLWSFYKGVFMRRALLSDAKSGRLIWVLTVVVRKILKITTV